jgi:hypothetical protein
VLWVQTLLLSVIPHTCGYTLALVLVSYDDIFDFAELAQFHLAYVTMLRVMGVNGDFFVWTVLVAKSHPVEVRVVSTHYLPRLPVPSSPLVPSNKGRSPGYL